METKPLNSNRYLINFIVIYYIQSYVFFSIDLRQRSIIKMLQYF